MKKLFLPLLLIHLTFAVHATTYYFSSKSGDDSRSASQAQNASTPWKTIDKLNAIMYMLRPGDKVLFEKGGSYYGAINVTASGSSGNPIYFGAYGSGAKPSLNGFATLTGWSQNRSNVWEANFSSSNSRTNMVIMNGKQKAIGRYPNANTNNSGYLVIDSHKGTTEITSSQLSGDPNWTGGDIVIRKNRWTLDRSKIGYHVGNTIGFDAASANTINDKFGFFVENHTKTLDQQGEWFFDKDRSKLQMYFNGNNPNSFTVKAANLETLVSISFQNYITFENLQFSGANAYGFNLTNSNNITINKCVINFIGINGVHGLSSGSFTLSNSKLNNINNNGINLYWNCSNALISDNQFKKIGVVTGMGQNDGGTRQGITIRGNNNLVQYNNLDSIGYNGIRFEGDYSTVQYNQINRFSLVIDDCGGIYTGQGNEDNTQYNSKVISNNIITNGIGAVDGTDDKTYLAVNGIYLDDNSNHVTVIGNTVANCGQAGIFNHNSIHNSINNNTMFNNGKEQMLVVRESNPTSDINIYNNIMFSKTADQFVSRIESYYGSNNLPQLGWVDNNYYCRPIDDNFAFYDLYVANGQYYTSYENMDSWRAKFQLDGNSHTAPATFPAFTYSKASGKNLYPNGGYDQNIYNVAKFSSTGDVNTAWNPSKLDAGTLQVSANSYSSSNNFNLTLPTDNSVTAGKGYLLTFSLQGQQGGRPIDVYLRQQDYPNSDLSSRYKIAIPSGRKELQFGFIAKSSSRVSVEWDVTQPNSMMWADNVMLQEATITQTNPDDYISFQYNATKKAKQFSLPAGTWMDAKGNTYSGKVTLQPYASLVVFKKGSQSVTTSSETQAMSVQGSLANTATNAATDITWQVNNQITDAAVYEVQRSADTSNFSTIGTATATKNSDSAATDATYQFNDANPLPGKGYYRIRQMDKSGNYVTSKLVLVNNISFKLNPNPAKDVLHLMFDQPVKAEDHVGKNISVYNTAGVLTKTIQMPQNDFLNRVDLNVSDLKAGMYLLSITVDGQTVSRKFLKME